MKNFNTIMALVFGAALLTGCATTQSDMGKAEDLCASNGGLNYINIKYNSTIRIVCNNGAKFTVPYKEVVE